MPEWPSAPGVNVNVKKFHAKDGVYQTEFEGIMHRAFMDAPIHVTENTPISWTTPVAFWNGRRSLDSKEQVGGHHPGRS